MRETKFEITNKQGLVSALAAMKATLTTILFQIISILFQDLINFT